MKAIIGFLPFFGCWTVLVGDREIGRYSSREEAARAANFYNYQHLNPDFDNIQK